MTERLQQRWDDLLHRARAWQPDDDPTAVLEAFGYALVYGLVDSTRTISEADRRLLLGLEPKVTTRARELALADAEAREDWLDAVKVVKAGASVLSGSEQPVLDALLSDPVEPSPRRLLSMLNGELDGFSAASVATWYFRRDAQEVRRLWRMRGGAATEVEPILLAADAQKSVRPPLGGRPLGELASLRVEAVFFDDERQLAIYSADRIPVHLMNEGFTTIDAQLGYWLGQAGEGVKGSVEVELRVGEAIERWVLEI